MSKILNQIKAGVKDAFTVKFLTAVFVGGVVLTMAKPYTDQAINRIRGVVGL